jgi:hypothetical protein
VTRGWSKKGDKVVDRRNEGSSPIMEKEAEPPKQAS